MNDSQLQIEPADGAGAYVRNVDVGSRLDKDSIRRLREALGAYGVLFFRDQEITPEQHIAFAEQFGNINVNRFFATVEGHPKIAQVLKEANQRTNIGGSWHTDHSYDEIPAMGSILLARETPPRGGDTLFANMYAAFEALSPGLQAALEGLKAVHSSRHVFGEQSTYIAGGDRQEHFRNAQSATQDSVHPVVIRHPISGRKVLYVNPGFTLRFDGWTDKESQPLLDQIYRHAARPEFTHRFQWQLGSIAFWDNRASWHYALNDYNGQRRLMHRITVEGEPLTV